MNTFHSALRRAGRCILAFFFAAILAGCEYEVPLTAQPSHRIDARLIGDWSGDGGKEKMKVRRWDDTAYVVWYNGELFRAYHSEAAGIDFVSVQAVEPENRRWSYMLWKLSPDGRELSLRSVNSKVVPKTVTDPAALHELLKKNAANPDLFNEEARFAREKAGN